MNLRDLPFLGGLVTAAPSVSPSTYANLLAHWKADSLSIPDGTAVGDAGNEWVDQVAANTGTASGTARPLYKTGIINSLPVIRFDGVNDWLQMSATLALATSDYTIMIVGTAPSGTDGQLMGFSSNIQVRINRAGSNVISNFWGASDLISTTFGNASTSARIMIWRRNFTGGTFHIYHRENKTDRTSGAPTDGSSFSLDRIGKTSFGGFLTGDIGEIVIYNAYRTDGECDNLADNYFQTKWGIVY